MCNILHRVKTLCVCVGVCTQCMILGKDQIMSVVFSSNLYSVFISLNLLDRTITP